MKKTNSTLHIAAFHDSINDTLGLASLLRNAGIQAQAKNLEDLPNLFEALRSDPIDMVLHLSEITEPNLIQVVKAVAMQHPTIPVLAMTQNYDVSLLNQAISQGACDLINLDNSEHVLHVLKREAERIQCGKRLIKLESIQCESERRCKTLMQSSRDAIAYIHGGMHIDANDVYLETLGFNSLDDMEGSPLLDLIQSNDHAKVREIIRSSAPKTDEVQTLENIHFKHQNGNEFTAHVEFSAATIDGEPCTQVLIRLTSNADTKALEEKITQLSQRDPLTGLFNRQYYLEQLDKALVRAHARQAHYVLIHLQISYPLEIRTKIGVVGRDVIISEAGRLLESIVGENALISLYSSNVFSIFLPSQENTHQATIDNAHILATELVQQLGRHVFDTGKQSVTVNAAAGVVILDEHSPALHELLNRAERVNTEAASLPAGGVVFFKPKEKDASQAEKDEHWNRLIQDALRNQQFRLLFQPILSLSGDSHRQRYEAYVRLLDEQRQLIEPKEFMASAERSGVSYDIDRYVIQGAIQHIVDARKRGLNLQLFIRISVPTLKNADFYSWFSDQIMNAQIYDGALVLQISETVAQEQLKHSQQLLENLQRLHTTLLIDGAGLNEPVDQLLSRLKATWVKLDRGLVESITKQKANQTRLLESIKALKQYEGLEVIVPHIENAASLQIASMSGADFLQGNFIQAPSERLDFDFSSF